jgi:tetratricopeptide (TPR) repeat protein
MPESYHWKKGDAWDVLGNHRRAADHLSEHLRFADNAYVRGRLAHSYARLGQWADASEQYERVNQKHPHPDFALGHVRAELRLGNNDRAAELLAEVQSTYPKLSQEHMVDLSFLREEMRHGWNLSDAREYLSTSDEGRADSG